MATVRENLEESAEIPHFPEREDPRTGNLSQPAHHKVVVSMMENPVETIKVPIVTQELTPPPAIEMRLDKLGRFVSSMMESSAVEQEEDEDRRTLRLFISEWEKAFSMMKRDPGDVARALHLEGSFQDLISPLIDGFIQWLQDLKSLMPPSVHAQNERPPDGPAL